MGYRIDCCQRQKTLFSTEWCIRMMACGRERSQKVEKDIKLFKTSFRQVSISNLGNETNTSIDRQTDGRHDLSIMLTFYSLRPKRA
jgi:hypothetical protein